MSQKKKKFIEMYSDNYYFLVTSSLFVIIGLTAILWSLYDVSIANRFDINNIDELQDVSYHAIYYKDIEQPYITVESEELEDEHLVQLQYSLYKDSQLKVPVYWVRDESSFVPDDKFHQSQLLKKSVMIDNGLHEVTSYEKLYLSESDVNSIADWEITSGEFKGDEYIVTGNLDNEGNSLSKYSQLKALSEVIRSINEDNDKLDGVPMLLDFETGDDKVLYHTSYEDILGKSSLYQSKKIEP